MWVPNLKKSRYQQDLSFRARGSEICMNMPVSKVFDPITFYFRYHDFCKTGPTLVYTHIELHRSIISTSTHSQQATISNNFKKMAPPNPIATENPDMAKVHFL